jgi:riboflavin transporter FmnP
MRVNLIKYFYIIRPKKSSENMPIRFLFHTIAILSSISTLIAMVYWSLFMVSFNMKLGYYQNDSIIYPAIELLFILGIGLVINLLNSCLFLLINKKSEKGGE